MRKLLYICCLGLVMTSCDDIILVQDISGRSIHALAPTDGAIINETIITFTWEQVEDAEKYAIQIATPNFEDAIQIVTDSTITGLNFNKVLEIGAYQWRIRGENSEYHTAYSTQSFTIE